MPVAVDADVECGRLDLGPGPFGEGALRDLHDCTIDSRDRSDLEIRVLDKRPMRQLDYLDVKDDRAVADPTNYTMP